jgi:hypothetical protein
MYFTTGFGLIIGGIGSIAWAQDTGSQGLQAACSTDYHRFCTGDDPGAAIVAACLSQYYMNLSEQCRGALDAQQKAQTEGSGGDLSDDDQQ